MIFLTDEQWETATLILASQVVADWTALSSEDRVQAALGLRERLTPVLARLSPDQSPRFFAGLEPLFKEAAAELLVAFLKNTMIYSGMPDREIVRHIAPSALNTMAVQLMRLTTLLWPLLPQAGDLQTLVEELDQWDANAELFELLDQVEGTGRDGSSDGETGK